MAQCRIERGHDRAAAVRQAQADGVDLMFNRPRQQRFVGGAGQRAGDDVDLIGRRDPQPVLFHHRQSELLHQFVHHAAAAVHDHQRTLMLLAVAVQRGKQTLQRFFTV